MDNDDNEQRRRQLGRLRSIRYDYGTAKDIEEFQKK